MKIVKCIVLIFCLAASALHAKPGACPHKNRNSEHQQRADYVVVGLGTSGAVVAKRLSDDMKTSVIALHRGKDLTEEPLIKFSRNAFITVADILLGPPFYQNGEGTEQSHLDFQRLLWGIAKPEGGASSINAGAYCRGTKEIYTRWEEIAGKKYWSTDRILAIFKSLENYHGETTNPAQRGFKGPLDIRQVPFPGKVSETFTQAISRAAGVPIILDYNDWATPIGASSQVQYTQKGPDGALRVSSATAFLNETVVTSEGKGVDGRKLQILFNSYALRTLWNGNKAIGVEFEKGGKKQKVFAEKGVIVCAGLFSSPFLLHSGIGPKEKLEKLNIPVVFDNPNVGQNLADQFSVITLFSSNPKDTPKENINSLFTAISWLPAPNGDPNIRQIRFSPINLIPGFTAGLLDLDQPRSRGSITIDSADPKDPPVIDQGVFSDPSDLELYKQAFRVYIKGLAAQLPLIDPSYQLILPTIDIIDNDLLLEAYIKQFLFSDQHFQSHCRMTKTLEEGGVVNSKGRVFGVRNLYVADNSISPQDMDGSPMASAYLIGANIAQILIDEEE